MAINNRPDNGARHRWASGWFFPAGATAVSVNLTVVGPSVAGELTAFPANEARPEASAISYRAGDIRANNGVLKLGNGALAFYANQLSGTVHLIIDVNGYFIEEAGSTVAYHVYYPFGEEATAFDQDTIREKLTGHERDLGNLGGAGDDLDYMHQRFCSPLTGHFLSTDRVGGSPLLPQSWNRYSYTANNPLKFIDPDGNAYQPPPQQSFWDKLLFDISIQPSIGPMALEVGGEELAAKAGDSLLRAFSRTLRHIFSENLDDATATAAGRELAGEVVARKGTGAAFNHIRTFEEARGGVLKIIDRLKNMASDARLSPEQRVAAQRLLGEASKKLDRAEALLKKAMEAAAQRTLDALSHPLLPPL
jgi:RHS repeat-associated protein